MGLPNKIHGTTGSKLFQARAARKALAERLAQEAEKARQEAGRNYLGPSGGVFDIREWDESGSGIGSWSLTFLLSCRMPRSFAGLGEEKCFHCPERNTTSL